MSGSATLVGLGVGEALGGWNCSSGRISPEGEVGIMLLVTGADGGVVD